MSLINQIHFLARMDGIEPTGWREVNFPGPADMEDPRAGITATLVGNKVYILGGQRNARSVQATSIFVLDLEAREWTKCEVPQGIDGRIQFSLYAHTATLVDDKILFIGGIIGMSGLARNRLVFSLDVALGEFSIVEAFGNPKRGPIAFHSADLQQSEEQIIVLGGQRQKGLVVPHPLFALNIKSMTWTKMTWKGQAPSSHGGHATCLVGTKLYIFGGFAPDHTILNDTHVLDLNYRVPIFTQLKTDITPEKRFGTILFQYKRHLFMFAGKSGYFDGMSSRQNDIHRFDLDTLSWSECPRWKISKRPFPRSSHKLVHLGDDVLVFGGSHVNLTCAVKISLSSR